jgi:hypothetical protein
VQLEKVAKLARPNSDTAVLALAAALEVLLHLSSSNHDAITSARTALARARSLQLDPDIEAIPQLVLLIELLDLSCSYQESELEQMATKRKAVLDAQFRLTNHPNWRDDGFIYLPIAETSLAGVKAQQDGHIIERKGRHFLTFSWLGKEEVEALVALIGAETSAYKTGSDGGKADQYSENGLSLVRSWGSPSVAAGYLQSQRASVFRDLLEAHFLFTLCFLQCSKGQWQVANETFAQLDGISKGPHGDRFPAGMRDCLLYLKGVILQGTGDLTGALRVYQSPAFSLGSARTAESGGGGRAADHRISTSYEATSDVSLDLCLLAALNSAFILRDTRHPQHHQLPPLLGAINGHVARCKNKYVRAHHTLLVSLMPTTTLAAKQYLRSAMDAGQKIKSAQTTALTLLFLQERVFRGIQDRQALSCARVGSEQVQRWGDPLWAYVAAGLESKTLEENGLSAPARKRKADAEAAWDKLPEGVKKTKEE